MDILRFMFGAPALDWLHFFVFLAGIFIFIAIAEKTRKQLGWPPEVNRKLVHILTGVLIFFSPFFFTSATPLVWMALLFTALNGIGIRKGLLQSIHGTGRISYGTMLYPLAFLLLVLVCWDGYKAVLTVSMMILALGDAAAAITGESLRNPHGYRLSSDPKTAEGSAVMFLTSFLVVFLLLPVMDHLDGMDISASRAALIALPAALFATVLEASSSRGFDNITAPAGSAFIIWFMLTHGSSASLQLLIGTFLAVATALISVRARFLTPGGAAAACILGIVIFGLGGWIWTIPILTFFITSSLLSKTGRKKKSVFNSFFEKSGCRDIGQVSANGLIAGSMVILNILHPSPIWYFAYLGTLAAVNADTWATELGAFSPVPPVSIRTFKTVTPGTSGGITVLGTIASLLGSLIIVVSGSIAAPHGGTLSLSGSVFWIITAAGFAACLVDSLLGATLQVQYACPACGRTTERRTCCRGEATQRVSGLSWLNNDRVNMVCSAAGAIFSSAIIIMLI
ncbi:DUF92 domain-containing protein [bacterium]|nr:DUF92 domain-containing protein [bacterium]